MSIKFGMKDNILPSTSPKSHLNVYTETTGQQTLDMKQALLTSRFRPVELQMSNKNMHLMTMIA